MKGVPLVLVGEEECSELGKRHFEKGRQLVRVDGRVQLQVGANVGDAGLLPHLGHKHRLLVSQRLQMHVRAAEDVRKKKRRRKEALRSVQCGGHYREKLGARLSKELFVAGERNVKTKEKKN